MRRFDLLAFYILLRLAASTQAQTSDQVLRDFRTQVLHQRLILQNFSADPVTSFEWTANGLSSTPPKVRTLGVFKISSANLHNGVLLLTGSRSTIYKDRTGKPTLLGDTPIVIKIAFNVADPTQVLPGLKQQLFFPTLQAAIAAIPLQDRQMVYPTDEPPRPNPPCPVADAHYERPKLIYGEVPDLTEEAIEAHFTGSVTMIFTVDENGHPTDLWLKKPAGMGLDEQATKAVSNGKFKPATCDGTAVKTSLMAEENFTLPAR
jgi:TonB family protein